MTDPIDQEPVNEIDRLRLQLAHARYEARDEGEAANRGYGALLAEKNAEIVRLRARLAEVEAKRDKLAEAWRTAQAETDVALHDVDLLRAKLAEVEAERDAAVQNWTSASREAVQWANTADGRGHALDDAKARLAAVEALCNQFLDRSNVEWIRERQIVEQIRAAARGEGDRPAARGHHQHEEWMLDDSAKGGKYCRACGEQVGEGERDV